MSNCCDTSGGFPPADKAKELARDHKLIWAEICAIQQSILDAVSQCQPGGGQSCTIVAGDSPMTFIEGIEYITVTDGGLDYFPIEAQALFFHPTGTGAAADVIISPSSGVNNFVMTNGGTGYDPIIATVDTSGSGNGGAIIQLVVNEVTGAIISTAIFDGGLSYNVGDPLPVIHTNGVGAVLTVASVDQNGAITAVRIDNPGIGYQTIVATVEVSHPTGVGFSGVVQVDDSGIVIGVSVQNPGIGYMDLLPIAEIIDTRGSGAVTSVGVDVDSGVILFVDVINEGANYTQDTTGQIVPAPTSSGAGATIDVVVAENIYGSDPYIYYQVLIDNITAPMIQDQMDQVISYFTKLGYSIEAQVNPDTMSTIQWQICW